MNVDLSVPGLVAVKYYQSYQANLFHTIRPIIAVKINTSESFNQSLQSFISFSESSEQVFCFKFLSGKERNIY